MTKPKSDPTRLARRLTKGASPHNARVAGVRFQKRHPKKGGRKKGVPNHMTREVRQLIREAAERVGGDGNGKDGELGYLMMLAKTEKTIFGVLFRAIVPTTINANLKIDHPYLTAEQALAELKARGLPLETLDRLRFIDIDQTEPNPYDDPVIDVTPEKTPSSK
jgi:hypothetical protein